MASKLKAVKPTEVETLVDELGRIDQRLKSVALDIKRSDEIKKQLRAFMDQSPADAAASFPGQVFVALVSEKRFEKRTDNEKLYKILGKSVFLRVATVTQKQLEDHLTGEQRASVTTEERTGSRTVTTAFKSAVMELAKVA